MLYYFIPEQAVSIPFFYQTIQLFYSASISRPRYSQDQNLQIQNHITRPPDLSIILPSKRFATSIFPSPEFTNSEARRSSCKPFDRSICRTSHKPRYSQDQNLQIQNRYFNTYRYYSEPSNHSIHRNLDMLKTRIYKFETVSLFQQTF